MKKLLLTLIFTMFISTIAFANSTNITINGTPLIFNSAPYTKNDTTMVPMRIIFENFNAKVDWNDKTKQITATTADTKILLTINSTTAIKNGTAINLSVAPEIVDGITFVPARFIAESFGATVEWDNLTKTVAISKDYKITNEYVPYSTTDVSTLLTDIANGDVVYYNGQYWATPKFASIADNEVVVYSNDVSEGTTNYTKKPDPSSYGWIGGLSNFDKIMINKQKVDSSIKNVQKAEIDGYVYVYGFYNSGLTSINLVYAVDVPAEFMNAKDATGVFSGIRMKKQNGVLFFNYEDLKSKNLLQ